MLEKSDKIGDYTLVKFLGKGQFGEVWLAEKNLQFATRKFQHALKFLSNREKEIDFKAAEAEIDTWIEASGHPNVMPVLDMMIFKDFIIIISEYADGGSLNNWLAKNNGKAPSIGKVLEMMTGILRGIEHLHSRNVVHRDLKPDNILLQGDSPRITDFGISRIVSESASLTKAMGSPAFMSPEAFQGSKLPQTDIWSAGVILYVMLSGHYPFDSDTIFGLRDAIQNDEPKPLFGSISSDIKLVITNALQKDVENRFKTAKEMRLAIESARYALRTKKNDEEETSADLEKLIPTEPALDITDELAKSSVKLVGETTNKGDEKVNTQPNVSNDSEFRVATTQPSPLDLSQSIENTAKEIENNQVKLESDSNENQYVENTASELKEKETFIEDIALNKKNKLTSVVYSKLKYILILVPVGLLFLLMGTVTLLYFAKENIIESVFTSKNTEKTNKEGIAMTNINLRPSPTSEGQPIGMVPIGSRLKIVDVKDNWYKIEILELGREIPNDWYMHGWVYGKYVELQSSSSSVKETKDTP